MSRWYETKGKDSDVVISTRIRLTRNVVNYPFTSAMSDAQRAKMLSDFETGLSDMSDRFGEENFFVHLGELPALNKVVLTELHEISPGSIANDRYAGLMMIENANLDILFGTKDHIKIQAIAPGIDYSEALKVANLADDIINEKYDYAFNEKYGYLSDDIDSIGTGFNISYMVHLPMITAGKKIQRIKAELMKNNIALNGMYGKETSYMGDVYLITMKDTRGLNEDTIINRVTENVKKIVEIERAERKRRYNQDRLRYEDDIFKTYGILKYGRIFTLEDAMKLLSKMRLAVSENIIKPVGIDYYDFYKLMMEVQNAVLENYANQHVNDIERDIRRAEYIRQNIPDIQ